MQHAGILQKLMNFVTNCLILTDPQGEIVLTNSTWKGTLQKDVQSTAGVNLVNLFPDELKVSRSRLFQQAISSGEIVTFEDEDHGRVWTNSIYPMQEDGQLIYVLFYSKDITELKHTEEALLIKNRALDFCINAISIADLTGKITYVNRALLVMWGYAEDKDILGKYASSFWEDKHKIKEIADALNKRGGWIGEMVSFKKDGTPINVEISASMITDNAGKPIRIMASFLDISERIKSRDDLNEMENIFNLFLEHSPFYVFFKDENIRSIKLSRNFEKMLGLPINELLGKSMDEIFPSALAKSMIADDMRIIAEGRIVEVEEELSGKTYSTIKFPIIRKGKPSFLAGFTSDITERKQAEILLDEQSKLLRKLSSRLAEVEETERIRIARELHDQIGQNLTALGINLNILKAQVSATANDETCQRFNDSLEMIEQTTACTRDLMSDLRPPVIDDYGLMASIKFYAERFSGRTGIEFNLHGAEILPRPSSLTEITVFRIVQEACNNISKHAQAKHVDIIGEANENVLRITIIDDGVGFAAAQVNKDSEEYGWGLLIMAERAVSIGGSFAIESKPGQGTKVIVEVPR